MRKYIGFPTMAAAQRGAIGALGGRLVTRPQSVDVLHASPHNFDRFDMSRIGSGEGNTLRGYGLYFGEHPGVSGPGGYYDRQFTAQNLGKYELNQQEAGILGALRGGHSDLEIGAALSEKGMTFQQAMNEVNRVKRAKSTIYNTRIEAPPHVFLDWDRMLGEQSPHVRSALHRTFRDDPAWLQFANTPVGDVLERMPERAVTARLRSAGVPGFKFLDQFSRTGLADRKTFNYVVTDDRLLNIMAKMGIAGFGALPALDAWHYQRDE